MSSDIRERLEQAVRDEEDRSLNRLRMSRETDQDIEESFAPVRLAAEELQEQARSSPSIEFTITPESVWITLADRDLRFGYRSDAETYVGEEAAHSWYDGEAYSVSYTWDTADACIEAMIRLCARYILMARAIRSASASGAGDVSSS